MNIKVKREKLISQMEKRLAVLKAEHKKQLDSHPEKIAAFCRRAIPAVKELLARLERDDLSKLDHGGYRGETELNVKVGMEFPTKDDEPRGIEKIESRLKKLRISEQDELSLNEKDDYLEYL